MAKTNLGRLLSSSLSSNLSIGSVATPSVRNSLSRMMISSSTQQQSSQEILKKEAEEVIKQNPETENRENQDNNDDDSDVNKATGEVGGPKGPEPTRYGDWERNGRCYDF